MSAKTMTVAAQAPPPEFAPPADIVASIAATTSQRDNAVSAEKAAALRVTSARANGGDTREAKDAQISATAHRVELDDKLATLALQLVGGQHRDLLVQDKALQNEVAARKSDHAEKLARRNLLEHELPLLQDEVYRLGLRVSYDDPLAMKKQIAQFEAAHRAELAALGVLGRR